MALRSVQFVMSVNLLTVFRKVGRSLIAYHYGQLIIKILSCFAVMFLL